MKNLIFFLLVLPVLAIAQIERPVGQRYTLTTAPVLAVSPNVLSFTSNAGTASAPQTFVISGVTGTVSATASGPDFEISLSSGSGYGSSVSGSAPLTVYVRVKSSTTEGTKFGMVTASFAGAENKYVGLTAEVTDAPVTKDTAIFSLSAAARVCSADNVTNIAGGPTGAVRTGSINGISFSSIATNRWENFSGASAFDGQGTTSGVFFTQCNGSENAVMRNNWIKTAGYNSASPQVIISGLKTGSQYTVRVSGTTAGGAVGARMSGVRVQGNGAISAEQTYNPGSTPEGPNSNAGVVFTNITPNSSGQITLWLYYAGGGGNMSAFNGIEIREQ